MILIQGRWNRKKGMWKGFLLGKGDLVVVVVRITLHETNKRDGGDFPEAREVFSL